MDILKILEESGKELYPEDLDFFETELATGGPYSGLYISQCMQQIKKLRTWMNGDISEMEAKPKDPTPVKKSAEGIRISLADLIPNGSNPVTGSLSRNEIIHNDIIALREDSSYKTNFKKYIKNTNEIDADFVDTHYSWFQPWELDAIVSVIELPEEFLEKYFGALDHDMIARYQMFSESFFMKHFSQLNTDIVLRKGKNEWRKKENRSKQLDVFLRLKGVKI